MRTLADANLENKRVFIRMDYNVKIVKGEILDDYKILSSFSTIQDVYNKKPKSIIIGSHLGRPEGKYDADLSCIAIYYKLKPLILTSLEEELEFCTLENYKESKITLVENLRFYPEEQGGTDNTILSTFFKENVDELVIDAFGVLHRDDFSILKTGLKPYAGNLVCKELKVVNEMKNNGVDLIILGGNKIKDKINILEQLVPKCKNLFIIGAIACTILSIRFHIPVGLNKVETGVDEAIENLYKIAKEKNINILLSSDYKLKDKKDYFYIKQFPKDAIVVDVGPETLGQLRKAIWENDTIFWNGPPGIFEIDEYSKGTTRLVQVLAESEKAIAGGGETSASIKKYARIKDFKHVSTGGGAFMKFLGGTKLPGEEILNKQRFIKLYRFFYLIVQIFLFNCTDFFI